MNYWYILIGLAFVMLGIGAFLKKKLKEN